MMNIRTITHQTQLSMDEFVADLMGKRVQRGQPKLVDITLNGSLNVAYCWTDGLDYYCSIFYREELGSVQELVFKNYAEDMLL